MTKEEALIDQLRRAAQTIATLRRSMMAHPDCEPGSEFDDFTSTAQEMEDRIEAQIAGTLEQPSLFEEYKAKAAKWDVLDAAIGEFYPTDEDGEPLEDEGGDLVDIGEAAARAFGYM